LTTLSVKTIRQRVGTYILPIVGTVILFASLATGARAQSFGTATDFNLFLFGNHNQSGTDVEGRVAVGGNANYLSGGYSPGMTIGSSLGGSTTNNLIVGGNYTNISNTVNGNIVVGGNAVWSNPTAKGKVSANGNVVFGNFGTVQNGVRHGGNYVPGTTTVNGGVTTGTTALPINFAVEQTFYNSLSSSLLATPTTGTYTSAYNNLHLTGTGASYEVFKISGTQLSTATSFAFGTGFNPNATIIVNVTGTGITAQNFAFNLGNLNKQKILFNFAEAKGIDLRNIQWESSILAPMASVATTNGQLNGTLVAKNLSGSMESHNYKFTGSIASRIPEPATLALLGLALPLASGARRRRG
jgi:choice-of-anchor A domain-containing protein